MPMVDNERQAPVAMGRAVRGFRIITVRIPFHPEFCKLSVLIFLFIDEILPDAVARCFSPSKSVSDLVCW